jgi:hypothetical protein
VLAAMAAGMLGSCAGEPGLGELRSFVELGTSGAFVQVDPAWLDTDQAGTIGLTLREAATAGELDDDGLAAALAALNEPSPDGTRAAAFVLPGCADTGAELNLDGQVISAELTGGENTNCDAAVYFLAVFELNEDAIPRGARLQR